MSSRHRLPANMQWALLAVVPVLGALTWIANLGVLLVRWRLDGADNIPKHTDLPFVYTLGAAYPHAFIALTAATACLMILSVILERHARDQHHLPHDRLSSTVDALGMLAAVTGSFALAATAAFNSRSTLRTTLVGVTLGMFAVSLLCQMVHRLRIAHKDAERRFFLHTVAALKGLLLALGAAASSVHIALYVHCNESLRDACHTLTTASSVAQWVAFFLLAGVFATYAYDMQLPEPTTYPHLDLSFATVLPYETVTVTEEVEVVEEKVADDAWRLSVLLQQYQQQRQQAQHHQYYAQQAWEGASPDEHAYAQEYHAAQPYDQQHYYQEAHHHAGHEQQHYWEPEPSPQLSASGGHEGFVRQGAGWHQVPQPQYPATAYASAASRRSMRGELGH